MRAFIHTVNGVPFSNDCATAKRGFEKLGVECVPFSTNEELETAEREDIVIAGMLVTEHALALRGVEPPNINYPKELKQFLGRKVWQCSVGDIKESDFPIFVKPVKEKDMAAIDVRRMYDLISHLQKGDNYQVFCSELVDFVSEWRQFIRYGEYAGLKPYLGTGEFPDTDILNEIIGNCSALPAGCAVDIGVTADGRTLLVEVNDGFALGSYGLDSVQYALLLSARWAELVGTEDPFKDFDDRGFPRKSKKEPYFDHDKLDELLADVVGATNIFCNYAFMAADYGGVADKLIDCLDGWVTRVPEVWEWLIRKLGLQPDTGPYGSTYAFPQIGNTRTAIDIQTGLKAEEGSLKLYNDESAVLFAYPASDLPEDSKRWLMNILVGYLERDALDLNLRTVFVLASEDEVDRNNYWLARGYRRVPDKDEEDLARAMGAHVLHDFILEKEL